jgi:ankyrin repeat protein
MQRRQFLHTGLALGAAGLLPGVGLAVSDCFSFASAAPVSPVRFTLEEQAEIGRFIAEFGIDVKAVDRNGTLLHRAVKGDWSVAVAKHLVSLGADIEAKDTVYDRTPLYMAVYSPKENDDVIKYLLAEGADVHAGDCESGQTTIHWAAQHKNLEIVQLLVLQGADIHAPSTFGWTSLHYAAWTGNTEVVQYLISRGVRIDARNHDGLTPLHFADNVGIAELLISAGADVDAASNHGDTPLHWTDDVDVAKLLVFTGASINVRDKKGWTPLDIARNANRNGIKNTAVVEYLESMGAESGW